MRLIMAHDGTPDSAGLPPDSMRTLLDLGSPHLLIQRFSRLEIGPGQTVEPTTATQLTLLIPVQGQIKVLSDYTQAAVHVLIANVGSIVVVEPCDLYSIVNVSDGISKLFEVHLCEVSDVVLTERPTVHPRGPELPAPGRIFIYLRVTLVVTPDSYDGAPNYDGP